MAPDQSSNRETGQILKQLAEVTHEISRGDYGRAQDVFDLTQAGSNIPELEELAESFGMMLVQVEAREFRLSQLIADLEETNAQLEATLKKIRLLENIKSHLGKFVPESVKSLIETNPDNPDLMKRDRDVSVLFLDVAGYTKLSEKTDQAEVNFLIETYFSAFLDDIHSHNGDINETAGDGLMIIFQGEDRIQHAVNAVATALAIQDKVERINRENEGSHQPIKVNIGIGSGTCSVGSTRFEGATGTRWTFTASGPVTNTSARIGALAQNGQVLVGEETKVRVEDRFSLVDFGRHRLKNVAQPVQVYELRPEQPTD